MKHINMMVLDPNMFQILEDEKGPYMLIGGVRAELLPHALSKQLSAQQIVSFVVNHLDDLALNVFASYLYDLMKNRKVVNVKIDDKHVDTEEDIKKSIND